MKCSPLSRLTASHNGETKCVIFVDSVETTRKILEPHVSTVVSAYPFIKAFGVFTAVHKLEDLASLPCVRAISPHTTATVGMLAAKRALKLESARPVLGYGSGVSAAVIDTGVKPHLDFAVPKNRIVFRDFIGGKTEPHDDNGHGTAVASILCGNGLFSGGKHAGIVPHARLVALKAIGREGEGGAFAILEAMQWIYDHAAEYNIRVACMSFGAEPVLDGLDPLSVGAEALWRKGIVVVTSAGNDGPAARTIRSPGCNPRVITVGGAEINSDGQITVADFSSRGPCGAYLKPDLIAPAADITACGIQEPYGIFSGTSMAAPIVAGAAALLCARRPDFSPDRVKELLLSSAQKLPFPHEAAGRGMLCLDGMLGETDNE